MPEQREKTLTILTGAVLAGLSVAIGAFGAHGLKPLLIANGRAETFELAVKYQFYHALGLMIIGLIPAVNTSQTKRILYTMFAGVVLFSGSLYALSISSITIFGAVTPFGGLLMIAGWVLLAVALVKSRWGDNTKAS